MREANEPGWWRRTTTYAAVTVGGVGGLCLLPVMAPELFDGRVALGLPLAAFLAIVGAPLLVLAAIFIFAGRQLALDRRHDVAER